MFDLSVNSEVLKSNIEKCRENGVLIPTFSQMRNPETIDDDIIKKMSDVNLWDLHPVNLFRITWKNLPKKKGYGEVNYLEIPKELTGVDAKIIALIGKWFPTGAHKVGATFGCLVPKLVTGNFDIVNEKAVWPSTGNYCRGGAYVSSLLGCKSIAILPEEMSVERFEWLHSVAGEVIKTKGCESNVKEIFDKCRELKSERNDVVIFNQFEEFGNVLWHYNVTGPAIGEVLSKNYSGGKFSAFVASSGSSGTLGAGYYLKSKFPCSRIAVSEALQCPTLLNNGFGAHRIEGIGDKHIPWIHDIKLTDMVMAVDDEKVLRLLRFFNEKKGRKYIEGLGLGTDFANELEQLGISSICNLVSSIKYAKYFELKEDDIVFTVFTDSTDLYLSRLNQLNDKFGKYSDNDAVRDYECLKNAGIDNIMELGYYDKKRIHNLKYYTWVEQQGLKLDELNRQWYEHDDYWSGFENYAEQIDQLIIDFNKGVKI